MVVCNTEALSSLTSSSTASGFATATSLLTPSTFGWLNGVSSSFSKFRFMRVRYFYLPIVSTAASGRVALSLAYDSNDSVPTSATQVIAGNHATFGPVWAGQSGFDSTNPFGRSDMIHLDVDTSRFDKRYYPYATAANLAAMNAVDKNIYVPCELISSMDANPTVSQTTGQLYVSYEVELIEPISTSINA